MAKQEAKAAIPRLRFPEFRAGKGWSTRHLGDACALYQPETVPSSSFTDGGAHLVYGAGGIIGRLDRFNHEQAEVIIGCRGICGNASLTQPRSWITGNAMVIRPELNELSKEFLFYSLDATDLSPVISGSAQPQITRQGLKRFPITIPQPGEQQKIADCLTALDEVIAAQGRKVEALKAHKRGLMQQLFPREGETCPRLRFPEFRDAPEWGVSGLGVLAKIQTGKKDANEGAVDGEYPFFTCAENHIYSHSYSFDAEAILIAGNANVGQTKYFKGKFEAYQRTYVLTGFAGVFVPYLYEFLSANLRPALLAQVQTSAMSYIRLPMLEDFQVFIPSSLGEQQRIADCLASLDTRITAETARLAALKTHKQGLMQQLFPAPEATGA